MARSKTNQTLISQAAAILAAEQAAAAVTTTGIFRIPALGYFVLPGAGTASLDIEIYPQEFTIAAQFITIGKTGLVAATTQVLFPAGSTKATVTFTKTSAAVDGLQTTPYLNAVNPGGAVNYQNINIPITISSRPAFIPTNYAKVFDSNLISTWSDFQLRGVNPTTGNPGWRAMQNKSRWQFEGSDTLFMLPNEICAGQTNGCGANPWKTTVHTDTVTYRALRTEYLDNAANGGVGLRVIDDNGNDSDTQSILSLRGTHRSGIQATSQNLLCLRYGYIEVECWMPYTSNTWPVAFWLLPQRTVDGNTSWELDVAEAKLGSGGFANSGRDEVLLVNHYNNYAGQLDINALTTRRGLTTANPGLADLYEGFHKFGMLWTKDYIDYFIDGVFIARNAIKNAMDMGFLNLQHRTWGSVSASGFSSEILVKNLSVYQSLDVATDRQFIWINEEAPASRSGYRFDAKRSASFFSFTGGNTTATVTYNIDGDGATIRQTNGLPTYGNCANGQKRYAKIAGSSQDGWGPGLTVAGAQLCMSTPWTVKDQSALLLLGDGRVIHNNITVVASGAYPAYGNNDTVEIALDRVNKRLWFKTTPAATGVASNWNNNASADPATNVGGLDISTLFPDTALLFATAFVNNGSATYNIGGAASLLVGDLPSGFSYF